MNNDDGTTEFMQKHSEAHRTSLGTILQFLSVIGAIAALCGAYLLLPYKLETLEKRTSTVEGRVSAQDAKSIVISETLIEIKTELRYLRQDLRKGIP